MQDDPYQQPQPGPVPQPPMPPQPFIAPPADMYQPQAPAEDPAYVYQSAAPAPDQQPQPPEQQPDHHQQHQGHHGHHQQPQPHPAYVPQAVAYEPAPVAPAVPLPPAPVYEQPAAAPASLMPQPVIQVYSPHGVEYVFLAIVLFMSAIGLSWLLDAFVNGAFSFSALSFPVAMMLITMPVFAWLFLRLKNAELSDSSLALDASKRRTTQSIQIVSFIICLIVAIGMLTSVFTALGGDLSGGSFVRVFFSLLMVVLVFGGILAYYWRDEHKG